MSRYLLYVAFTKTYSGSLLPEFLTRLVDDILRSQQGGLLNYRAPTLLIRRSLNGDSS